MRALKTWQQFGLCNMSSLASLTPFICTECRAILIIAAALPWLGFYAIAVQSNARHQSLATACLKSIPARQLHAAAPVVGAL
jgi:hypothetical protein